MAFAGYPLIVTGHLVGVMALYSRFPSRLYRRGPGSGGGQHCPCHLSQAGRGTPSLERRGLPLAHLVQQALLPKMPAAVHNFDIGGSSCPAGATGGDFFDDVPATAPSALSLWT